MSLTFRSYHTFGCTIVSTILIQSLKKAFPKDELFVYTENPDLFQGLDEINFIVDLNKQSELAEYDIDLRNYLEIKKPQESKPYRHLSEHMLEIAEKQLGSKSKLVLSRSFAPKMNLTVSELLAAKKEVASLRNDKPTIWLQTKSRVLNKEVPESTWESVVKQCKDYTFINLSNMQYSRRESIALTKFCDAGITLDSFLLHGSKAAGAKNVLAILVSTHKEVVTYAGNTVLDGMDDSNRISAENIVKTLNLIIRQNAS